MSQYTVVCHIASRRPQKIYKKTLAVYAESEMSMGTPGFSRVYCLIEVMIRLRRAQAIREMDEPLVEERPNVDNEHEDEQDGPSSESTCPTVNLLKIKQQTHDE